MDGLVAEITSELKHQERTISWLARKSNIPYPTLTRRLSGSGDFKVTEVYRIADALGRAPGELVEMAFADLAENDGLLAA